MVSNSRSIKPTLKKSLKFRIEASLSPKRAANAALFFICPNNRQKKPPLGAKYLQWLDSTAFLMKETNKYGPDFCVCRLGRHNFSVPARHHAFTITSLTRCLHRRIGTDGADGTWHPKTRLKQRYILR